MNLILSSAVASWMIGTSSFRRHWMSACSAERPFVSVPPDTVVRSVTFTALVVGNVALILVNRSWRLPVWRTFRERRNKSLKWILGGAAMLPVAMLTVQGLRHAFNFGPITFTQWCVALAAGFVGVAWFEIYKTVVSRR